MSDDSVWGIHVMDVSPKQSLNRRLTSLFCLFAISLCLSGCFGGGYSIPGFGSKDEQNAEAQKTNLATQPDGEVSNQLDHVASAGVQLGNPIEDIRYGSQVEQVSNEAMPQISPGNPAIDSQQVQTQTGIQQAASETVDPAFQKATATRHDPQSPRADQGSNLATLRASLDEV